ncbi:uncharacterized protein EDB91DRAFT_1116132 [Suillus paluster]|uniref:uncharacterized protein n=1 Tax=Suillus paluster TaxID=48578 RepID=UPI001B88209B|nr:uncharacterized protein EDB91DRAFT_1116132 [Suillus paluster]KAG1747081.1 hypothetical protein EDB91DRAFT_1116132 [Suillus paluster]
MFTSRSIIFVLLSFLAGANACIRCPAKVDGIKLSSTVPDDWEHVTVCYYKGKGVTAFCQYYTINGESLDLSPTCPRKATVIKDC